MVVPKIILLRPDNDRIIVCIDREDRGIEAADFAREIATSIRLELGSRGEPTTGVDVVVADRAFEAWLLADINGICKRRHLKGRRHRCYESYQAGTRDFGAKLLAKVFGRYEKRVDGPALFSQVDFAVARLDCRAGRGWGSRSLDVLLTTLGV